MGIYTSRPAPRSLERRRLVLVLALLLFVAHRGPAWTSRSVPRTPRRISRAIPRLAISDSAAAQGLPVQVLLTRQAGQNGRLRSAVEKAVARSRIPPSSVNCIEAPCIEFARGPDFEELRALLAAAHFGDVGPEVGSSLPADAVVLTSPEAARIYLS